MHPDLADLFAAAHAAIDALKATGAPEAALGERSASASLTPSADAPLSRPVGAGPADAQTRFHAVETADLARIARDAASERLARTGWSVEAVGSADAAGLLAALRNARRAGAGAAGGAGPTGSRGLRAFVSAGPSGRGDAAERRLLHKLLAENGAEDVVGVALSTDGRDHAATADAATWVAGGVAPPDRRRRLERVAGGDDLSADAAFDALGDALRLGPIEAPRLGLRLLALRTV